MKNKQFQGETNENEAKNMWRFKRAETKKYIIIMKLTILSHITKQNSKYFFPPMPNRRHMLKKMKKNSIQAIK